MTHRPQHPYPLNDKQDFAAWRVQHRRAYALLDTVVFAWRGSNAHLRGFPGVWAAYSRNEWMAKSGLSLNATKLEFFRLELDGLIIRKTGSWDGFKPRTFIQPTPIAIGFMGSRPHDYDRLGQSRPAKPTPTGMAKGHPKTNSQEPPKGQPNGEPHITSFPSSPSIPTKTTVLHAHEHVKGKGGFGEDRKVKKKLILKKQNPNAPIPPPPQTTDVDALIAVEKAKAKEALAKKRLPKLLEKFPILKGAHEKFVKHPYQRDGWIWATWTPQLIAKKYAVYEAYVDNWYSGKNGKGYKPLSDEDAEFDMPPWDAEADAAHWDELSGATKPAKPKGVGGLLKKT